MNPENNVNNEVPPTNADVNTNNVTPNEVAKNTAPVENAQPKLEIITENKIIQEGAPSPRKEETNKKKVLTPTLIVELIILAALGIFCLWYYVLR